MGVGMGAETEVQAVVTVSHLLVKPPPRLHRMRTPGMAARELTRQWRVKVWVAAASSALAIWFQNCLGRQSRMVYCRSKAVERE